MDQEDHVQAIRDELAAIARMPDPLERAKAATLVLQLLTAANAELARLRREDILVLVDRGLSYRKIGAAIGVDGTRVKQIQSGRPTGNSSRARAAKPQARELTDDPAIREDSGA
jgi:DNA-directed RNA polymerase specialized sigma24 family protein